MIAHEILKPGWRGYQYIYEFEGNEEDIDIDEDLSHYQIDTEDGEWAIDIGGYKGRVYVLTIIHQSKVNGEYLDIEAPGDWMNPVFKYETKDFAELIGLVEYWMKEIGY